MKLPRNTPGLRNRSKIFNTIPVARNISEYQFYLVARKQSEKSIVLTETRDGLLHQEMRGTPAARTTVYYPYTKSETNACTVQLLRWENDTKRHLCIEKKPIASIKKNSSDKFMPER